MTALDVLAKYHSWQLNRLSVNTFPNDVVMTVRRKGQLLTEDEAKAIITYMQGGECYRCRIGKGRFFFAETALKAAQLATAAHEGDADA